MMDDTALEKLLIHTLAELVAQTYLHRKNIPITLQTNLDKDLGLDSMTRVEYFRRLEKALGQPIPESIMANASTLQVLLKALRTLKSQPAHLKHQHTLLPDISHVDVSNTQTLTDVLAHYVEREPNRPHIYLQAESGEEIIITYGQLWEKACTVSASLTQHGLKPGETVAIMLPTCAEFFYSFMGVLLAGGIAVPIYPPFRPDQIEAYATRESKILHNAEAKILITFAQAKKLSHLLSAFVPTLHTVTTATALLHAAHATENSPNTHTKFPAMIQYTSGSTGQPKGVLLSHANLLANIRAYGIGAKIQPSDIIVSWLPLYHDMGLIGTWLGSFYHGLPVTILSPLTFLRRPEQWLWAIHYHRATISGGPNFGFELCLNKVQPEQIEGLDLSTWRLAFNGAEAIMPETLEKFTQKFAPYGFQASAMTPVYGLAEASVGVSISSLSQPPKVDCVNRDSFQTTGRANPAPADAAQPLRFVDCGHVLPGHAVRVVDATGHVLADRQVGELEFKGPSVMMGYFQNPTATQAAMHDGWVKTGDLAYLCDGAIFITGRIKDLIIKAGRNLHPESIEQVVGQVSNVRKGCVAALGIEDPTQGTEKLVILAETYLTTEHDKAKVRKAIIDAVTAAVGVPPDQVELIPPKHIPKTSSGKLRRQACKARLLQNQLTQKKSPLSWQLARLWIKSIGKRALHYAANIGKFFYTAYTYCTVAVLFPLIYASVMLAHTQQARKNLKWWSKWLLRLLFLRVSVHNARNIPTDRPVIFAANHASYLDALVLISVLPTDIIFIGKEEILANPMLKNLYRHLEHLTVEREAFSQSIQDMQAIQNKLKQKSAIMIFPEGTFQYTVGLRPFKMGAFKLAAETGSQIIPIALKGTRKINLGAGRLLRPANITVTILNSLRPNGKAWDEVIRLQTETRQTILPHCGEQALNG